VAHMHYKGTGKVHSFKGLLADGAQTKIRIQGPVGAIAWRITKFQIMPHAPGDNNDQEHVVIIWREERSSAEMADTTTSRPNFVNNELLGTAINISDISTSLNYAESVIFDNTLFSRNIYISHRDIAGGAQSVNYYIELEEVKVGKAGMAQLAVAAARRTIS